MQLGADLAAVAGDILDRRLLAHHSRPLAVALSGGGDSLALLLGAHAWARRAGRTLLVLTVDHGLSPQSFDWTRACADHAARLGLAFQALAWTGDKPATGLPAAARDARHRLIAEAAHRAGARVILVGHTAGDIAEARTMRARGSTTPEPAEWSPSPAWPEGRGLFLLRPLLAVSRDEIRAWLTARGETWVDDPANHDIRFARARARLAPDTAPSPSHEGSAAALAQACVGDADVGLTLDRATIATASPADLRRFLGMAAVCAGGGVRRPATDRLERIAERVASGGAFTASLAGARIAAAGDVRILREAGEARRGGLAPIRVEPGQSAAWDGRYEIIADRGLQVRVLAGLASRLAKDQQRALQAFTPAARAALPVIIDGAEVACPSLGNVQGVIIRPLVAERLWAASGLVTREPV